MKASDGTRGWLDATLVAALLAIDPAGLGGVCLRAWPGAARGAWLTHLCNLLSDDVPVRRIPLSVSDDRLLGGLDLAATLRAGRAKLQRGLLAEAAGGFALVPMAERMSRSTRAHLSALLDTGEIRIERDGFAERIASRISLILCDEGVDDDAPIGSDVLDRVAFVLDLTSLRAGAEVGTVTRDAVMRARANLPDVRTGDDIREALCAAAINLGVASLRPSIFAARTARVLAALAGESEVSVAHAALAARLVLSPRATIAPADTAPPDVGDGASGQDPSSKPSEDDSEPGADRSAQSDSPQDIVVAAAAAAIPENVLRRLTHAHRNARPSRADGGSGAVQISLAGGRPFGTRRGDPRGGARLNLIATLRAAAPWQALRRDASRGHRVHVERGDFHVTRYKRRSQALTIFVVDASGSSALERLAEAKGAVELLLAECYVRRDQVAVVVFRGRGAEVLLAPTRSLVRAKRSLAGLPGGGGTPLAAAIDAGGVLAERARRAGITATLVLLTDGRANITRDGVGDRERATREAFEAARRLSHARVAALVLDISRTAQTAAEQLAHEMGAIYAALPYADASAISALVRNTTQATRAR